MTARGAISWAGWLFLCAVVSLWGVVEFGGDRSWLGTLVLYSPRWAAALPLCLLVPAAFFWGRRTLLPLLLASVVVFGPLMGFNVPARFAPAKMGRGVRVISCNLNDGRFRMAALNRAVIDSGADILLVQELPPDQRLLLPRGWQVVQERGLAVASRWPLRRENSVPVFRPPDRWPAVCLLHCVVASPGEELDVCSIQLPTARSGLLRLLDRDTLVRPSRSRVLAGETAYRRRASAEVAGAVARLTRPLIVAGDLNLPVQSAIYAQHWSRYRNSFSESGLGYGFTQRVVFKGVPVPIRIDHILTSAGLSPSACTTGPDVGSDHLPLLAEIAL